jgi:cytochrome P450
MATQALDPPYVSDIDPFSHEAILDALHHDSLLREVGPVVYLPQYDIWVVARHAEVQEVLRDWETYSSEGRPFYDPTSIRPEVLLTSDPPVHSRVRASIQRVLSGPAMRRMGDDFRGEAARLVDELLADGPVELDGYKELAARYVLKVFPDMIGMPQEGREYLLQFGDAVFQVFGPHNELWEKGVREGRPAIEYVERSCKQDALTPDGIGSSIYARAAEGEITELEAELLVKTLYSAGSDTTIFAITSLMKVMAENPDQWQLLRDDPSLARNAFEENLRYQTPARLGGRMTTRETELSGVTLPKGALVLLLQLPAGRDPRRWEDPDRFDITRKSAGHVGLGYGIHACVGQAVARIEGVSLVSELARRVERVELLGPAVYKLNQGVHAIDHLPIRLTPAA